MEEVEKLIEDNNFAEAAKRLSQHLNTNFDDSKALFLLGYCFLRTDGIGLAYQLTRRAADIFPGEAAVWHNIGKIYHEIQDDEQAEEYFRRALKVKPSFSNSLEGLGMTSLNRAQWQSAIDYCNRALAEDPEASEARTNRGMAYLALRRWREGWRDYNTNIGRDKNRKEIIYGDEPRWDGSKGKNIVVYGEQGIGDEISFASCIPDLIRDSKSVVIECDGRLEKLFERSFGVKTYGTRYHEEKKGIIPAWRSEQKFDGRVTMGELSSFYRTKDEDFPGVPYLKPNPVLVLQWKALLESLGPKPRIGLTWTGGLPHTGQRKRSVNLDTYGLLFKNFDAHWISLQYKEVEVKEAEEKYGVKIHDWDWGTRVFDYDHTCALISQLDLVISVCTTVVHAAGGLGVECWCLVPEHPMWRYMDKGSDFPWAKSVTLYRQKGREWPIGILLGQLKDRFGNKTR